MQPIHPAYWLTATDTDAGKTTVACALISALNAAHVPTLGFKPISSGAERVHGILCNPDTTAIMQYNAKKLPHKILNPWCFEPPIAPHIAAKQDGATLCAQTVAEYLDTQRTLHPDTTMIAEGAGGVCIPLNEHEHTLDLMVKLNWPIIFVVRLKLGGLNHAYLAYEAMQHRGIKIQAWLTNQTEPMTARSENIDQLTRWIQAPCLGHIPYCPENTSPQALKPYLDLAPLLWQAQ